MHICIFRTSTDPIEHILYATASAWARVPSSFTSFPSHSACALHPLCPLCRPGQPTPSPCHSIVHHTSRRRPLLHTHVLGQRQRRARRVAQWPQNPPLRPLLCTWDGPFPRAFVADCLGSTSGAAARNNLAGVRAWHTKLNAPWPESSHLKRIVEGVKWACPASSCLPLCAPARLALLCVLHNALDPSVPFDTSVLACACTAFWGIFCLGELLLTSQAKFSSLLHPTCAAWTDSSQVASIFLPWTKTTHSHGSSVILVPQLS
jgi:hypothetical protein